MSDERLAEAEQEFRQAVPDSYGDTQVPDWALVKLLTEYDRMRAELAEYHRLFRPDAGLSGVEDTPEAIQAELDRPRTVRDGEQHALVKLLAEYGERLRPVVQAATTWEAHRAKCITKGWTRERCNIADDLLDALAERVEEAKR